VILLGNSLVGKRLAWRPEDLSQPPMTIPTPAVPHRTERPWGWFEAVAAQPGFKIKRIGVWPGQQISLQKHHHRAEHWVVVQGRAHVTLDDQMFDLAVG